MGKRKTKTGDRVPSAADLTLLRVNAEQEWAYLRRMERLSFRAIASLSGRSTAEGGVDHLLSPQAVSQLVQGYYVRLADVQEETLAQHRDRELSDLDLLQRAAGIAMARAEAVGAYDVNAAREYRAVGERRSKLLGLDAIAAAEVPASESATLDQLNATLVALGEAPIQDSRAAAASMNAMLAEAGLPPLAD